MGAASFGPDDAEAGNNDMPAAKSPFKQDDLIPNLRPPPLWHAKGN